MELAAEVAAEAEEQLKQKQKQKQKQHENDGAVEVTSVTCDSSDFSDKYDYSIPLVVSDKDKNTKKKVEKYHDSENSSNYTYEVIDSDVGNGGGNNNTNNNDDNNNKSSAEISATSSSYVEMSLDSKEL